MTEEEARDWLRSRVDKAAFARLEHFMILLAAENQVQNLIAPSTLPTIWARHIVDSAQLLDLTNRSGHWIDIGTGAGFPGLVVGLLRTDLTILVEPRRRRAEFLQRCIEQLAWRPVEVIAKRIEHVSVGATVISARAVATIDRLFANAAHCATSETLWLLPRGRGTLTQVADAERSWRGVFHVKQSVTDPESGILIAQGVTRR